MRFDDGLEGSFNGIFQVLTPNNQGCLRLQLGHRQSGVESPQTQIYFHAPLTRILDYTRNVAGIDKSRIAQIRLARRSDWQNAEIQNLIPLFQLAIQKLDANRNDCK